MELLLKKPNNYFSILEVQVVISLVFSEALDAAPQPVSSNHLLGNPALLKVIACFPALLDGVLLQHQEWPSTSGEKPLLKLK